jgi:5-methylcytosine-specific restriction endonuclease McrA
MTKACVDCGVPVWEYRRFPRCRGCWNLCRSGDGLPTSISPKVRRLVAERCGGICALCNSYVPEGLRHVDHILPTCKGGTNANANLRLLCQRCNLKKRGRLDDEVKRDVWVKKPRPDQPFLLNPNWK